MANVSIKFNNKDYLLSCDDGQEESLKKLTKFLDKKYSELKDKLQTTERGLKEWRFINKRSYENTILD